MATPKKVRTEGLWTFVRAGMWGPKPFGWIFGPLFLWFISFGGAKEMNKTTLGMQKNQGTFQHSGLGKAKVENKSESRKVGRV
jgi:hypothetical protein